MTNDTKCQYFWPIIHRFKSFFLVLTLQTAVFASVFARVNCPDQGPRLSAQEYCKLYAAEAQRQMQKYGIPASITLAQGLFESGYGSSYIAVKGNNHFGIKAYRDWKGAVVRCDDDRDAEPFCKFKNVMEGYEYHSKFLRDGTRYAPLFKRSKTDYKGWAKGLQKCGYATDPKYPERLIDVIERYNLAAYDKTAAKASAKTTTTTSAKKSKAERRAEERARRKKAAPLAKNKTRTVLLTEKRGGLKYVVATRKDDIATLAKEFNLSERQIRNWNDLPKGYKLREGEIIYLQAKREKADKAHPTHTVALGESLQMISQRYGVTVESIVRRNKLRTATVQTGQVLKLR